MNTKLLMATSAVVLGTIGIILSFMPQEVSRFLHLAESTSIVFRVAGALYVGFAILNWTAKANLIGGIYSRPVAMGNFTHFLVGGLALVKLVAHNSLASPIGACAILYVVFSILFGYVLFTSPVSANK